MEHRIDLKVFVTMDRTSREWKTGKTSRPTNRHLPSHLFDCWPEVAKRLRAAKQVVLFLDFDGTLAPLRRRPAGASLSESTRRALHRLVRYPRLKLYVISGRRRADLRRRVGIRGVHCLGLYGSEREGNTLSADATRRSIQESRRLIEERVRGLQGVWVEDKGLSFVVHYRGAPKGMAHRAQKAVCETLERLGTKTRTLEGENSWEVLPKEMGDKGIHTRKLLAGLSHLALPIYVGDDTADESAFAELRRGLTVRVGASPHTQACFFLCDPAEVTSFLKRLGEEMA